MSTSSSHTALTAKAKVPPAGLAASLYTLPDPTPTMPPRKQYSNGFVAFRTLFNSDVVAQRLPVAVSYQALISSEAGRRWRLLKDTPREAEWSAYATRSLQQCEPNTDSRASKRRRAQEKVFVEYDAPDQMRSRRSTASPVVPGVPAQYLHDFAATEPPLRPAAQALPLPDVPMQRAYPQHVSASSTSFVQPPVAQLAQVPAQYYSGQYSAVDPSLASRPGPCYAAQLEAHSESDADFWLTAEYEASGQLYWDPADASSSFYSPGHY